MAKLNKRVCALIARLVAVGAAIVAVILITTSRQKTSILGISVEAKYSDTPTFKYFMIVNVIASVYGFVVLFLPAESLLWRLVLILDLVMTMVLTSSISAALAVAQVGKKGNTYAGWLPICGQVPKYCDQVTGALISGFITLVLYMLLLLYSVHSVLDPLLFHKS